MIGIPKIEGVYVLQKHDLQNTDATWPQQVEDASKTPAAMPIDLPHFLESLKSGATLGAQVAHLPGKLSRPISLLIRQTTQGLLWTNKTTKLFMEASISAPLWQ